MSELKNDYGRIVTCAKCNGNYTVSMVISKLACPACNGSGKQRID